MPELDHIETIFYCDESKFSVNDGDPEDAIFYFSVSYAKSQTRTLITHYRGILEKHGIDVFHASDHFKKKNPNDELMLALCNFIMSNGIKCFCFKYSKARLYDYTKREFSQYNNDIIDFGNQEFQALYYFLVTLDIYLEARPQLIVPKGLLFFDRNVYGKNGIEAFNFNFQSSLDRMVFVNKKKIALLGLPDFFGYIFRQAKLSNNKAQFGDNTIETSPLVINSYLSLLGITNANLFHFLDTDVWIDKIDAVVKILPTMSV